MRNVQESGGGTVIRKWPRRHRFVWRGFDIGEAEVRRSNEDVVAVIRAEEAVGEVKNDKDDAVAVNRDE